MSVWILMPSLLWSGLIIGVIGAWRRDRRLLVAAIVLLALGIGLAMRLALDLKAKVN